MIDIFPAIGQIAKSKPTIKGGILDSYLVISALGEDRPGIVNKLSMAIYDSHCNIVDSRMSVLGGEFAIILMVSGNEKDISALEASLPDSQASLGLTIITRKTDQRRSQTNVVPYNAKAIAIDNPGIVYQIANFFSNRNINIENLSTESYAAPHTGTPMFALDLNVNIPSDINISDLREDFFTFCDELNIDAALEPMK
ncbi:MAG: glycine cleavage system protein R [Gammaproteobacteria bacterium]